MSKTTPTSRHFLGVNLFTPLVFLIWKIEVFWTNFIFNFCPGSVGWWRKSRYTRFMFDVRWYILWVTCFLSRLPPWFLSQNVTKHIKEVIAHLIYGLEEETFLLLSWLLHLSNHFYCCDKTQQYSWPCLGSFRLQLSGYITKVFPLGEAEELHNGYIVNMQHHVTKY